MTEGLASFGLSDIGLMRPNNEDVWVALPDCHFYALADGMGGHNAGEIAAKIAIDDLTASIQSLKESHKKNGEELVEFIRYAIEKANRRVFHLGQQSETLAGMGTTLCCLLQIEEKVIYAHVGDSRIYRLRNKSLEQLTSDHSLFAKWLSTGKRAEECSTPFPYKNVITRAIGTKRRANPDINITNIEPGDLFLLCSDGLSDVLKLQDIEKILDRSDSLSVAAARLIEKAKINGSHDNITVLLIQNTDAPNLFRQQLDNSPRSESIAGDADRSQRASG